jgi:hypothetical protein
MSSISALYPIKDHLVALIDTRDMCQTDEDRAACDAEIERYVIAEMQKVDNVSRFLGHLESQAEFAEKEIKRLKAREMVFVNLKERLEQYVIRGMQARNLRVLNGDTSRLTLRENTPALEVDDEAAVPGKFKTIIERSIDKMGIMSQSNGEQFRARICYLIGFIALK